MITKNHKKPYIIAEAGVNHNGNIEIAKKLIIKAKQVGADAVKFQIFKASKLATKKSRKANYQIKNTGKHDTQFKMLKGLELGEKDYFILKSFAQKKKIDFLTSVFDSSDYNFLKNKLKEKIVKIPSGEINNIKLLKELDYNNFFIILSTGMSTLREIIESLNIIAKKIVFKVVKNKIKVIDHKTHKKISKRMCVMHCVTDYPVSDKYANMNAIDTISKLGLFNGYSDHTIGTHSSIIAVSKGAQIIEKHFTLNKNMKGPDHKASMNPKEFHEYTKILKKTYIMMGSGKKIPQKCEIKNMKIARNSLVASKTILKGETFTKDNIAVKRPAGGLSPMLYFNILGKKSKKKLIIDSLLK